MPSKKRATPISLQPLDALFGTNEETNNGICEIEIGSLHPFPNHPFQVKDDKKMEELSESITQYGVLVPGIVRLRESGGYELVAGHRRKRACELAGLEKMPVIIKDLTDMGLFVKSEEKEHAVGHCSRCHTVVEPLTTKQWFVKMKPLAGPAMEAVQSGKTKFVPERFSSTYIQWLENIHDWCISRQLWWGHRIPVWYCDDCGEVIASRTDLEACPKCGSKHIRQDPDVLDTWFSSALWPFSTMGWPDRTPVLNQWYPTSTMVTGYDIIFFWVARMMFMSMEFMKEIPFRYVFIHGLVRDSQGRKMSKSLGNGIDPLEVIEKYGADALRFTLVTGNTPGNDMRFYYERVEGNRNFANKLWNASKFTLMNLDDYDPRFIPEESRYTLAVSYTHLTLPTIA